MLARATKQFVTGEGAICIFFLGGYSVILFAGVSVIKPETLGQRIYVNFILFITQGRYYMSEKV